MDLAAAVLDYYFTRAGELSRQKRFHLASRMAAWTNDPRAAELIKDAKDWVLPGGNMEQALAEAQEHAEKSLTSIASYELRKPFFDRHPELIGLEAELFRLRHVRAAFGIDGREALFARHSREELQALEKALLDDRSGLRALSSWAVNYIYLLHLIALEDEDIPREAWYALGDEYDLQDPEQLRLLLYLYTHCIVADSNFYVRPVPASAVPLYTKMLARLESLLASRLPDASLDTKLEFLVCCRLVGYQTALSDKIYAECAASVSNEGTFIVDTHNVFADKQNKKSFEASEHRNVLFVMSVLPRKH